MKTRLLKILAPRIAGILAVTLVNFIPRLQGSEEAVTSAILAVWGVVEIFLASSQAKRQELLAGDQRILKAEGIYTGKVDGKYGPKTSAAIGSIHGGRPN